RLAAGLEDLDDDHTAAAVGARVCERLQRIGATGLLDRRWGQVQDFMYGFYRFGALGAGEQAVMADAGETLWGDVDEEAADELTDVEAEVGLARDQRLPSLASPPPGTIMWTCG